ncbi:unnamed protein product [Polarella glacialis]|uniref:Histone RNA hairpin-binding protein RNA-binding domain-containing protein n=1 Tax=Polarella glacialis TaxID=89957 RepID=A0A813GH55_POLGL|nr:unnamed protein product [Polarella glacialis]
MRQIMIGKARPEYRRYIAEVPAEIRDPAQPGTPNPKDCVSKRQFDRFLGDWRRRLHEFDAEMGWATETLEADAAGELLGCGEAILRELQGSPQRALQLSAPEFTPHSGPCPPPWMLLTPGGPSLSTQGGLSTQGCPSVTPVSTSRCHTGGRGGNGSSEQRQLPPHPAFPPAPVQPVPMEPAAPSSGIVQLRLADQLPEPLPPGVISTVSAAAAAAAAADSAAAASAMQWSMPWETDCEALLAAACMSPDMAALLTLQPDPETPLRLHTG